MRLFSSVNWRNLRGRTGWLFSILAIFLTVHLLIAHGIVFVKAEGEDVHNGLHSFMASPDIQRRAGRPLADVSENLHWHDEAIPLSGEGEENDEEATAVIVDDEVPEFTMGPFLEKAFSMAPKGNGEKGAAPDMTKPPWTNSIQFNLPIHEADLLDAQNGMPTTKINKNSNEQLKTAPNVNAQQRRQKAPNEHFKAHVHHHQNTSQTRINHNNSHHPTITGFSVVDQRHCSWQMLNTFLLVWSILSTVHWLWLCSNKLFRFVHFMEISGHRKNRGQSGNNRGHRAKMMASMMAAHPPVAAKRMNAPARGGNKTPLTNSSTEHSSNGSSMVDERKKGGGGEGNNCRSPRPAARRPPHSQHRTIISIPSYNSQKNLSIAQRMRRAAAQKRKRERNDGNMIVGK